MSSPSIATRRRHTEGGSDSTKSAGQPVRRPVDVAFEHRFDEVLRLSTNSVPSTLGTHGVINDRSKAQRKQKKDGVERSELHHTPPVGPVGAGRGPQLSVDTSVGATRKRTGSLATTPSPKPKRTYPKSITPTKKEMWWLDDKMRRERLAYDAKFNARQPQEEAYKQKMAKLAKQREKELIGKCFKRWKSDKLTMQSGIEHAVLSLADKIPDPEVCSIAEDVMLLTYDLVRSRSVIDYTFAALSFVKRRSQGALTHKLVRGNLSKFISTLIKDDDVTHLQSGAEETVATARNALQYWPRVKQSPLWRKINTVVVYATSLTLFGDSVDSKKAIRIEELFYKSRHMAQADFVYNVLDLLLFIAERGVQVVQTKNVDVMFHSGTAYEKWYDSASDVIAKSKFLSNPEAHGIDIHSFTSKLDLLIQQGQSMYKYACEMDKAARVAIRGTVQQLLIVRATHINRKTAQKTRKAPLALVVEGHSSVGKTTFANVLHYYYGVIRDKNIEAGARYTRMSTAQFWDGFSSDQWSLLIDDAGSIKPDAINDIDPSVKEILQVVNNAPYSPDMAALEEKGAAPFMGELVIITTNTPDLSLDHYFNTPGAVARRLPFHLRIRPKVHLRKNATMIDETRLPVTEPGSYPDWWDIEVLSPVLVPMSSDASLEFKQTFKLETVRKDLSMKEFLTWYHGVILDHNTIQDKVAVSEVALRNTGVCKECFLPTGMCACQNAECSFPTAVEPVVSFTEGGGFAMQSGFEFWGQTEPTPPVTKEEEDFYTNLAANLFLHLLSIWWYGALTFVNLFLVTPILIFVYTHFRTFFTIISGRMSVAQLLMRVMWERIYWALLNRWSTNVDLAATAVWRRTQDGAAVIRRCGDRVQLYYFQHSHLCTLIVVVLTVALAAFGAYTYFRNQTEMQGNVLETIGTKPLGRGEEDNVWKRDVHTPSLLDLGRHSISWRDMSDEQITDVLGRNCAFIKFHVGTHWKTARCIGLGGQYFMTTNHSVPEFDEHIRCQLVRSPVGKPSGNVTFTLCKSELVRDLPTDIAIFCCKSVPPVKNITDLFVRERLSNFRANGFYLGRGTDGIVRSQEITAIYGGDHYNPTLRLKQRVWWGKAATPTVEGDCGSLLVARSATGPVLLGIHQLGSPGGTVGTVRTTYEDIMRLLDGRLLVSANPPVLDAPSTHIGEPEALHPKSPVNFLEEGTLDTYGSFTGFRASPKFRTQESIMAPFLRQHGYLDTHTAPKASGWEPKYAALSDLVDVFPDVCTERVETCVEAYVNDILKVGDKWKTQIMVYDIHTAVNGVPGLKYVDGLKRSTSAGFPYNAPKQGFLIQLEPTIDYPDHVKLTPEVEDRVVLMLERYRRGERAGAVFRAAHKDEALPIQKVAAGKVRSFMIANVELTVIMRMYALSFVRIAQSNHFLFECAPGMEAQSVEWDFLYQYLTQFGRERGIAGDFQHYDRSMHPAFVVGAFEVMARFVERSSGTKEHANVLRAIGFDIAFAYVDFFGDLIMLFGKNPSGQALTAIVNGIVNSLYMRFVWIHCSPSNDLATFQTHVSLMTYGDDNIMGVSGAAEFFTHTAIRDELATIGVVYTMADKSSESKPYIDILAEGTFLKRGWRWCEETGSYVAPLELGSISKMLMTCLPSRVVTPEFQAVDTIRSANAEYFWHGREVFEDRKRILEALVDHLDIRLMMQPPLEGWHELLTRYVDNSRRFIKSTEVPTFVDVRGYKFLQMQAGRECPCGNPCPLAEDDPEDVRECRHCGLLRYDEWDLDCYHCGDQDVCDSCHMASSTTHRVGVFGATMCYGCLYASVSSGRRCPMCELECHRTYGMSLPPYGSCTNCGSCVEIGGECVMCNPERGYVGTSRSAAPSQTNTSVSIRGATEPANGSPIASTGFAEAPAPRPTMGALSEREGGTLSSPEVTTETVQIRPANTQEEQFRLQSGVESTTNASTGGDVMASTTTNVETVQTVTFIDSGVGDTISFGEAKEQMFTYDRQSNADLSQFLSRPRLISSVTWTPGVLSNSTLDPWSLYLGTPEVEYKLNNFAFFRGTLKVKVVVNAAPFYYGALMMYYTPLPASVGPLLSTTGVKVQQSQRPHIWILPQNNEGGEMTLPFFYPKNYVAITSASEVATLGNLTLTAFTQLSSANGASSNGVQMQIYAWMEDVTLFGPTVGLSMQSGDEYGNGPVSAPAAAAAHWATYLSRVPIIGRFAKATSIGASAVSQMAKLFGWTNVPVIEDVKPLKNVPFHDLASAHISEPTSKFLLDPKGEMSVDPSLVGLGGDDELSIAHIVQKESYLATGTWTAGGAAGALIFSSVVSPNLGERGTASAAGTFSLATTPMAWVAAAFGAWRGDIIFRFKVICSKYHSGRLRIHWDPLSSLAATTDYTHITYTAILDIQESDEVEFRVPYMQALPWLQTTTLLQTNQWSTTAVQTPQVTGNGTLTLRVLNNLTAPTDTAACSVLVFVRGAENLEFANPRDIPPQYNLFSMQSGTEPCAHNTPFDERFLVNWGEPVPSVRLLLRRSSLVDRVTVPRSAITATDEAGVLRLYQSRLPPAPGYDTTAYTAAKGIETPATTYPFQFTYNTYLSWFAAAFVALRGSTRWHFNMVNPDGTIPHNISVTRRVGQALVSGNQGLEFAYIQGAASTSTTQSLLKGRMWVNYGYANGSAGTALTNPITQTGVSVEFPMMTNYLFQYAHPRNWFTGSSSDGSNTDNYILDVDVHPASGVGLNRLQLQRYAAAGTDFTLHFFLNTPTVNYNPGSGSVPA